MIWLFHLAFILTVAALTHLTSVMAFPALSQRDAFSLLYAHAAENKIAIIPDHITRELPYFDPYIHLAACRYNLATGPVRIRTARNGAYVSVVLIETGRGIYASISDRTAVKGMIDIVLATKSQLEHIENSGQDGNIIDDMRVQAPKPTGLALIKVLVDPSSNLDNIKAKLAKSTCASEDLKSLM